MDGSSSRRPPALRLNGTKGLRSSDEWGRWVLGRTEHADVVYRHHKYAAEMHLAYLSYPFPTPSTKVPRIRRVDVYSRLGDPPQQPSRKGHVEGSRLKGPKD